LNEQVGMVVITANYYVLFETPKNAFMKAVWFVRKKYPLSKEDVEVSYERFGYNFHLDERDWNYMMGW